MWKVALCLLLPLVGCSGAGSLTGQAIAASLQKSGLPAVDITVHTAETDPNTLLGRPGQYVAKVNWKDSRVLSGAQAGDATIEVFERLDAAKRRAEYVEGIGKASPMLLQYVSISEKRNAVLRVPSNLTPEQARAYSEWFARL